MRLGVTSFSAVIQMRHASTLAIRELAGLQSLRRRLTPGKLCNHLGRFLRRQRERQGSCARALLNRLQRQFRNWRHWRRPFDRKCRVVYNNIDRLHPGWHCGGAKLIPHSTTAALSAMSSPTISAPGSGWMKAAMTIGSSETIATTTRARESWLKFPPEISSMNNICVANRNPTAAEFLAGIPNTENRANLRSSRRCSTIGQHRH